MYHDLNLREVPFSPLPWEAKSYLGAVLVPRIGTLKAMQASSSSLFIESQNHRIIELEGAYKVIECNPLLNAGIQIKADLTDGGLIFS